MMFEIVLLIAVVAMLAAIAISAIVFLWVAMFGQDVTLDVRIGFGVIGSILAIFIIGIILVVAGVI